MPSPVIEGLRQQFFASLGISENTPIADSDAANLIDQWSSTFSCALRGAVPWSCKRQGPHRVAGPLCWLRRSIRAAAVVFRSARREGAVFPSVRESIHQTRAERRDTRRPLPLESEGFHVVHL